MNDTGTCGRNVSQYVRDYGDLDGVQIAEYRLVVSEFPEKSVRHLSPSARLSSASDDRQDRQANESHLLCNLCNKSQFFENSESKIQKDT